MAKATGGWYLDPLLGGGVAEGRHWPQRRCECQAGGRHGGELRNGQVWLAEAVLEVPLVWFSICSRRVETQ